MNRLNRKKWIPGKSLLYSIAGIAVLAIAGAWWNWSGAAMFAATTETETSETDAESESLHVVRTTIVSHARRQQAKTYPGTVAARTSARMAFRVGGPLVEVNINPGDEVKAGQVLMRIDPRDFENRVASANAALASAKAKQSAMNSGARSEDLEMLKAKRAGLIAQQANLRAEFQRNDRLIQQNAVSRSEHEASRAALTAIDSQILAADEELKKAKTGARKEDRLSMSSEVQALEVQLKTAKDQLADAVLLAPFDATVSKQNVENFESIGPGQEVLVLHDISALEIKIALPEKDVIRRAFDDSFKAKIKLLACPETELVAVFKEIDTEADAVTRTYQVTLELEPTPGINVFPGMVAEVLIEDSHHEGTDPIVVPTKAIHGDGSGGRFVWVVENQKVQKRPVTQGALVDSADQIVLDGVDVGETIVVSGGAFLYDGEEVLLQ